MGSIEIEARSRASKRAGDQERFPLSAAQIRNRRQVHSTVLSAVELAIRTNENAWKDGPIDAGRASKREAWRREAGVHNSFEERRYDRFRVMFEGRAEESLAAQATTVLTPAFWRIGQKLGEYPSNTIVTILYTEKQFRDITRAPEWSGGQYDVRIRIPGAGAPH